MNEEKLNTKWEGILFGQSFEILYIIYVNVTS